ncbi:MAG: hypothetical protein ISS18_15215 [Bacteroidales bacterium]|nr:hypothetical protein [Bacteroidales bacterium]
MANLQARRAVAPGRTVAAPVYSPVVGQEITPDTVKLRHAHPGRDFVGINSMPARISFTMDNSGDTVNSKNYIIFDAIGIVDSLASLSYNAPTPNKLTNAIIKDYLQSNPIWFAGIRLESTASSTQFNNELTFYEGDLDGRLITLPYYLSDAIEGAKYSEKIQNYKFNFVVNARMAITVTVNASETLYATFFLRREMLRS